MGSAQLPKSPDVRALEYFVNVAECRSFTKAAAYLRISQPALSRQVRKIEDQLGVKLFVRNKQGVVPTEAGARLLERSIALLNQLKQTCAEIADEQAVPAGQVTFGMSPSAGEILMPELIQRCRSTHPRIQISVIQGYSSALEEHLDHGRVDLAILPLYGAPKRFVDVIPLMQERIYLVGHGKAPEIGESIRLRQLAGLPLVLPTRANGLRMIIDNLAAQYNFKPQIIAEVDGMSLTKALVGKGIGFSLLPAHSIRAEVAAGKFRAALISHPQIERTLVLATRKGQTLSRAATVMVQLTKDTVQALAESGIWSALATEGRTREQRSPA
ncbi:MAG: LysR family transcriptional regulator [Hyphomicrobiales bacterium]